MRSQPPVVTDTYAFMPLFSELTPREFQAVAVAASRLDLPPESRLAVQGKRRMEFGIITEGSAKVLRDGRQVGTLRVGEHFGEFTVLRGVPAPTTIVAETPVTVAVLTAPEFRALVESSNLVRGRIERAIDHRIRDWVRSPLPRQLASA
jgi:CRP-like cAMP-binding protein